MEIVIFVGALVLLCLLAWVAAATWLFLTVVE